jgi:hypothetical protein
VKDTGSLRRIEMMAPSSSVSRASARCLRGVDSEGSRALSLRRETFARERRVVDCWYLWDWREWWSCLSRSWSSFSAISMGDLGFDEGGGAGGRCFGFEAAVAGVCGGS